MLQVARYASHWVSQPRLLGLVDNCSFLPGNELEKWLQRSVCWFALKVNILQEVIIICSHNFKSKHFHRNMSLFFVQFVFSPKVCFSSCYLYCCFYNVALIFIFWFDVFCQTQPGSVYLVLPFALWHICLLFFYFFFFFHTCHPKSLSPSVWGTQCSFVPCWIFDVSCFACTLCRLSVQELFHFFISGYLAFAGPSVYFF